MANRHERRHGTSRKKSSWKTWLWVALIVLVIAAAIFFVRNRGTGVDYTQYNYTDEEFANPEAAVVIEEFSDFECPYCQALAPTMRAVRDGYPDTVRVEYKQFPLRTIHPLAQGAAEASECAREQERFWAYHDVLFESKLLDQRSLGKHAEGLGLDVAQWESCIDGGSAKAKISQDLLEGNQRGVRGTPTVYLNGELFSGRTLADFERAIAAAEN